MMAADPLRTLRLSRQAALVHDPGHLSALLIGLGSIGSNAFHLAVSLGYQDFTLVDPDVVSEENRLPGFFPYGGAAVGKPKVEHLAEWAEENFGLQVVTCAARFEDPAVQERLAGRPAWDIVILAPDGLYARRAIYRDYSHLIGRRWWLDGRMGGPGGLVYTVPLADQEACQVYFQTLQGQEGQLACGEKATAPLTKGFLAAFIGQSLADIANGVEPPFFQRYDLRTRTYLAGPARPI